MVWLTKAKIFTQLTIWKTHNTISLLHLNNPSWVWSLLLIHTMHQLELEYQSFFLSRKFSFYTWTTHWVWAQLSSHPSCGDWIHNLKVMNHNTMLFLHHVESKPVLFVLKILKKFHNPRVPKTVVYIISTTQGLPFLAFLKYQ